MKFGDTYGKAKDINSIKKCLDLLSEEQRMVVLAYYYDNMSEKEIAEIFETSEDAVKIGLHLARKSLLSILEEDRKRQNGRFLAKDVASLVLALDDILGTNVDIVTEEMVMAKISKNIYTLSENI